jgi:hypothetical protein
MLNMKRSAYLWHIRSSSKRGFTMLLAALIAAIVLALGSSIYSIARKQVTLSSIGRDSQFAFYAADTIIECVLYHDVQNRAFAATSGAPYANSILCDEVDITPEILPGADGTSATTQIDRTTIFREDEEGNPQEGNCVEVLIIKDENAEYPTVLHADGYSVPCNQITSSGRALQRSIELRY